jgi:hypothetical protein
MHRFSCCLALLAMLPAQPCMADPVPRIVRISVASNGAEANGASRTPSISATGRFIAFTSVAGNLVAGDSSGEVSDVFWHDRDADENGVFDEPGGIETRRISVGFDGSEANGWSLTPSISADGRYVAFVSQASNLVPGDANGRRDVFRHDVDTGTTVLVSQAPSGPLADNHSTAPSISSDGQQVAFASVAGNLVQDDSNGVSDVFLRDIALGTLRRVSVASTGAQADGPSWEPSLSGSRDPFLGHRIAFRSLASNLDPRSASGLVGIYLHAEANGATWRASRVASDSMNPHVSETGDHAVFTARDEFFSPGGSGPFQLYGLQQAGPRAGLNWWLQGAVAAVDGVPPQGQRQHSRLVFDAAANGLLPPGGSAATDILAYDFAYQGAGITKRVSLTPAGSGGNGHSARPVLSSHLRYVAFESAASDLVQGDANGVVDIFVADIDAAAPADHANLVVSLRITGPVAFGASVTGTVDVYNLGPGPAIAPMMRLRVSGNRLIRLVDDGWAGCETDAPVRTCMLPDPLPAGATVRLPVTVAATVPSHLATDATYIWASVASAAPDPFEGDNTHGVQLAVHNCSGFNNCPIEWLFCRYYLPSAQQAGATAAVRDAASTPSRPSLYDMPLYFRVRDRLMRPRAEGGRLITAYYAHAPEVMQALAGHGDVRDAAVAALSAWEPALRQALQGEQLDRWTVAQADVDAIEAFLDALRDVSGDALRAAIDAERQRLPGASLVGSPLDEALDAAFGVAIGVHADGFETP